MPSFEDTLARMKGLYTYGNEVNESNNLKTHTLEHRAVAADGITYGIIRENSKYYIKSAPKGKETIAEAYNYLGGFCNKSDYEYSSYAKALKQFELKLASINEAVDSNVNIESLNPFRANEVLAEATQSMKNEIARQRQIMYNAAMLMNESIEIGAARKDDVVKFDGKQPEAETGKRGDEGNKETKAQPDYKGSKTNGVKKAVAPFENKPSATKDQLKEGEDIGDAPLHPNTENWGTEGIGKGRDPKQVGWEMDGQQTVNEEEDDWASKGLPSTPGVGEADTDHNNDPFNNTINEGDEPEDEPQDTPEGEDFGEEGEDLSNDTDFDAGIDDDFSTEGGEGEDEFDLGADGNDELGSEEEFDLGTDGSEDDLSGEDDLGSEEPESDNNDLQAQIDELQAKLDELRAQLNGEDEPLTNDDETEEDFPDGEDFEDVPTDYDGGEENGDELGGEDELGDDEKLGGEDELGDDEELDGSFEGEEDTDTLGDDDNLDECGDFPVEEGIGKDALKGGFKVGREAVKNGEKFPSKEVRNKFYKEGDNANPDNYESARNSYNNYNTEDNAMDAVSAQPGVFGNLNRRATAAAVHAGMGVEKAKQGIDKFAHNTLGLPRKPQPKAPNELEESKRAFMNKIVESVVKDIISEDELHVFGKHPGYRKKPMELPTTGEDKNQWGEDWNDESVHNEEPFGSKIGNGDPFNQLVDAITKNVIAQMKNNIPIEGSDKKKE